MAFSDRLANGDVGLRAEMHRLALENMDFPNGAIYCIKIHFASADRICLVGIKYSETPL